MGNTNAENKKDNKSFGEIVSLILAMIGSQIVYGGLLAFLGLRVALNPSSAPTKISWGLGVAVIIAAGGVFISFITTKSFNLSNIVPIIESFLFLVLGVCMIIFAKKTGVMLEGLVCITVIVCSISNILCLINLNNIQAKLDYKTERRRERKNKNVVLSSVDESVKRDFEKYNGEFINAATHIKKKFGATTWGQLILNVLLIGVAMVMLLTDFSESYELYLVSGIIMLVSGLNEMVLGIRAYREKKQADELEAEEELEEEAEEQTEG